MASRYEIRDRPASLPPLRVKRKDARAKLDHNKYAKSLFALKDRLVTSDFVALMGELFHPEQRPKRGFWDLGFWSGGSARADRPTPDAVTFIQLKDFRSAAETFQVDTRWSDQLLQYTDIWSDAPRNTETADPEFREKWREIERDVNAKLLGQSRAESDRLQGLVSAFEESHGVSLDVLETTTMFVCRQCNRQAISGKFKKAKCDCGEQIASLSDVDQVPLSAPAPGIQAIWTENMWLEEGIAYQFRAHKYDAESGLQVLGGSGVDHEVDVIAERGRPSARVFCECKHREIRPNDVLVFAGKVRDIGGQAAMIFTTATSVDDRVQRLARANGVQIVHSVIDKPQEGWAEVLRL